MKFDPERRREALRRITDAVDRANHILLSTLEAKDRAARREYEQGSQECQAKEDPRALDPGALTEGKSHGQIKRFGRFRQT